MLKFFHDHRVNRLFVGGLLVILLLSMMRISVNASLSTQASSGGLGVDGALLVLEAKPGETYIHKMVVSSGTDAQPMEMSVDVMGFGESLSGSFEPLPAEKDTSPYSARTFITKISDSQFKLEPGQSVEVDATVEMPPDFSKNTRYAIIYIHSNPVNTNDDNGVGQILAVSVPVIITPPDAELKQDGTITDLIVNPVESGKPIEVLTTVKNTGNRHYKVQGQVNLKDPSGNRVALLMIPLTGTSIFPTFSRQVGVSYNALDYPGGLEPGTYTAEVQISREDGSLVEQKNVPFEIKERYNPFPDIDEEDLLIVNFNNEEPGTIDAIEKAGIEIRFEDTGLVTGTVAIGRYRNQPSGTPAFGDDRANGGTGASGLHYVAVKTAGFDQGTAHFIFHYQPNDLGELDPNSLFLSHRQGDFWQKLKNLAVQTGSEVVLGDLQVVELVDGTIIGLGGGATGSDNPLIAFFNENLTIVIIGGIALMLVLGITFWLLRSRASSARA